MIRKRILTILGASALILSCGPAELTTLDTPEQRSGYAIGMDIGQNLAEVSEIVDQDALIQGLRAMLAGDSTRLNLMEAQTALQAFSMQAQALVQGGDVAAGEADPMQKSNSGYAIGMDIGRNLKEVASILDTEALVQGLRHVMSGDSTLLTGPEVQAAIQAFSVEAQALVESSRAQVGTDNLAEGEAFLATNGQREGIITTSSGLQYEVMNQGSGAKPTGEDRVRVHYAGTFTDGTPFESTYETDTPAEFQVGGVIPGWTEALQLMSVGSKYRLFIPGDLAYGPMGSRTMEPNKTLIFEVELLDIL